MTFYHYFKSYANYFWQWEDDCEVVAIPQSNTIAYRKYIAEVIEHLSPVGVPPFGSLLLAMIATNPGGSESLNAIFSFLPGVNKTSDAKAISFLKLLCDLPKEYKESNKRLLVFQTIFANCHNSVNNKISKGFANQLTHKLFDPVRLQITTKYEYSVCYHDFRIFELLEAKFPNVQSILNKIAELPEIEEPIQIEEAGQSEKVSTDLVSELVENSKTFQVGTLVKRIWSGLNIPFHHSLPSVQPIGGVSDLSNKGDLSRMLITEFAHDDSVFLSRYINNESLYINREIPPQKDDRERIILLDVSVKSWGTPKSIALSIAVAIANHPKTDIDCAVFAVGHSYYPVHVKTVDGVIDGTQRLDACMNSTDGLRSFFKEYATHKNLEVIYISSTETQKLPEVMQLLNEFSSFIQYYVQTDAEGNIELYKKQQKSKKFVQHIQLPLGELWKRSVKPIVSHQGDKVSYPILFPLNKPPKFAKTIPGSGTFIITKERNLLRQPGDEISNDKGWEMIYEGIPGGADQYEMGLLNNGQHILLMFAREKKRLTFLNIETGKQDVFYFNDWKTSGFPEFMFYNGSFIYQYLGFPSKYWMFDVDDEVRMTAHENIPKEITAAYSNRKTVSIPNFNRFNGILKNVNQVYINGENNLVLNEHELIITSIGNFLTRYRYGMKSFYRAERTEQNEFTFANGSTVTIHPAGMFILQNNSNVGDYKKAKIRAAENLVQIDASDPRIADAAKAARPWQTTSAKIIKNQVIEQFADFTVYIPAVLDEIVGIASKTQYSGYDYYFSEGYTDLEKISTVDFWQKYIRCFIKNIQDNGN